MMELHGTVGTKVNVPDYTILEAAIKIIRTKTGISEDYYLSDDGKVLMEAYDHGNHRGGIERKTIREATEDDRKHLAVLATLDALRRKP